jgi:zinc/manganese transport system substrate-binding protein
MKKIFVLVSILLGLCSSSISFASLNIVTTTADLAAIAEAIGGKHVDVYALTPGTRDPHFAEARPSMIRRVYRADLLLSIGAELEIGWLPAVLRSARNSDVQPGGKGYLDLSKHVDIIGVPTGPVDRSMGDVHAAGNPHYWLNPSNGLKMAVAITEKLSELDHNNASAYRDNLTAFETQLERKLSEWRQALAFLQGQPLVAYHTSLLYLANAFGFEIVKDVEPKPGIAPSASYLAELVNTIKKQNIQWLIMEPYYEKRSAEFLNRKTGIKVVVIPQSVGAKDNIKNYFDVFDGIVAAFAGAI